MADVPANRRFLRLVGPLRHLTQRTRAIVSAALAGFGWLGAPAETDAGPSPPDQPLEPSFVTASTQIRRRTAFVLRLRNAPHLRFAFQHRSHSSHSSHRSHASHASHVSHYSGGSGSYVPPAPAPTPAPAVPEVVPTPRPIVAAPVLPNTTVTVRRINRSLRTITGKTSAGQLVIFHYRDSTQLDGDGSTIEAVPGGHPPLRVGQRITITYRLGPDKKTRIATKINRW